MTSFLVDQQLPKALVTYLAERGCDTRHIKEYPVGTTMPDPHISTRDLLALFASIGLHSRPRSRPTITWRSTARA